MLKGCGARLPGHWLDTDHSKFRSSSTRVTTHAIDEGTSELWITVWFRIVGEVVVPDYDISPPLYCNEISGTNRTSRQA